MRLLGGKINMDYCFNIPTKINIMDLSKLKVFLQSEINNKKILLLISESMIERFELRDILKILKYKNSVIHISNISPNPNELDVESMLGQLDSTFHTVIAFGGGSTIDLAKAAIALCDSTSNVKKAILEKEYLKHEKNIEFIAIPTTSGTGSEVTQWATIWDSKRSYKMSIDAPWLAPTCTILVPELTVKMNLRQTLSTGLDALTHAVESYWSKKSNLVTRELSKIAINMIVTYMPKVLNGLEILEYREKMSIAALYAGLAFANTKTTASHAISYPLTMNYGIEHGFAASITLLEVMKFNFGSIPERGQLLGAFSVESIDQLQLWLDNISKEIQVLKLHNLGIGKEDIAEIAQSAMKAGRMYNNPVNITVLDVIEILNNCY